MSVVPPSVAAAHRSSPTASLRAPASLFFIILMILVAPFALPAQQGGEDQDGPLVLSPFAGPEGGTAAALAENITRSLDISLRLAADGPVEFADFILPHLAFDRAQIYYDKVNASRAVFGTVAAEEGGYVVRAGLWTGDESTEPDIREYRVERALQLFEVADRIAVEIASAVVGRDLTFGTVRIANADALPAFAVYVDGNLTARNTADVRVLAGDRRIIVARPGALGDEPVQQFNITVPPDERVSVTLDIVDDADGQTATAPDEANTSTGDEARQEARRSDGEVDLASGSPDTIPTGRLVVESRPDGAEVLLDDRVIGTTPLNRFGVPEGRYELVVRRQWFIPVTQVVDVTANQDNAVTMDLEVDPDHPEVAEHLVNPGGASIAALGMTALQAGLGGISPFVLRWPGNGRLTSLGMVNALTMNLQLVIKAGLLRPGHAIAAPSRERRIVNATSVALSSTFLAGAVAYEYYRQQPDFSHEDAPAGYDFANAAMYSSLLSVAALELYDIAFVPAAGRRRNAAVINRIDETGSLPAEMRRAPGGIALEVGGGGVARVGYTFGIIRHYLYGHASAGVALTGVEPIAVGPSLLVRLDIYPMGARSGAFRTYVAPAAVAETDFQSIGLSVGYDSGLTWLTQSVNLLIGTRTLYGTQSGVTSVSFYVGTEL